MIIYRTIAGVKTHIHDIEVDDQTELKQKISGEDLILSRFTLPDKIDLQIGDFVEFKDSVYTILDEPQVKKSQSNFSYNIQFKSDQYILKNVQVINPGTDEVEFFLFGNAIDMISVIISNLNRVYGGEGEAIYFADFVEQTEGRNISFNNENCLAALQRMAQEFQCEFTVKGKKITFRKKIGVEKDLTLEYKKGLREIERVTLQNGELLTKLYAFGSERNITNDYGSKRLKIPAITNNTDIFGTIERAVFFDDIYPRYKGQISAINTTDETWFTDTNIDFNVREQLMGGVTAKVVFNTGDLAGREFEIVDYRHSTKEVQIKRFTDDSDLTLPNNILKPIIGDKYVFVDIQMPQTYIDNAEAELLEKATEYLEKYSQPNVIYKVKPDFPELRRLNEDLNLGDIVTLKDLDFGIEFQTRILSLTQKINNEFEYAIDIGNQVTVSYITQVLTDQRDIRNEIYYRDRYWSERFNRIFNNIENFTQAVFVNMGEFDPATYYYNNQNRIDYVYLLDEQGRKLWYYFRGEDHTRGEFIEANWQFIGDNFDIIATNTILAENANIGNWIIQNGMIVSQSIYESDDENEVEPTAQLNGTDGYIRLVYKKLLETVAGVREYKQSIMIDSRIGEITFEREGDEYQLPALARASAGGFSADFAAMPFEHRIETSISNYSIKGVGAFVGDVTTKIAWGFFGGVSFVAGIIGKATNLLAGIRTYGGVFFGLKSYGRYLNVVGLNAVQRSYVVSKDDDYIVCKNTGGQLGIYLPDPSDDYSGRVIEVKRVHDSVMVVGRIYTNQLKSWEEINHGDLWRFVNDGHQWNANYMGRTD